LRLSVGRPVLLGGVIEIRFENGSESRGRERYAVSVFGEA
jgi:hypothetical protein